MTPHSLIYKTRSTSAFKGTVSQVAHSLLSTSQQTHPFVLIFVTVHSFLSIHSFFNMLSFTASLAASALIGTALSKPIPAPQVPTRKGFTLSQSIEKAYQAGPVLLQNTFLKYNVAVPTDVQAAASNGSVTATPEQYDSEYLCPVTIGGQTLNLDFDTGSADL